MYGLIREENAFGPTPSTKDIARHLYTRMLCGKVVIVATNPEYLLLTLQKQWLKLGHKARSELAGRSNAVEIRELSELIARMQSLRFTASWDQDDSQADVYIATTEQLLQWAPECRTMYISCNIAMEKQYLITALMPKGSLVVICKLVSLMPTQP